MIELSQSGWREYAEQQIGGVRRAVVEHGSTKEPGVGRALTDNFLRLTFETDAKDATGPRPGQLRDFRLLEIEDGRIRAEPHQA